MDDAEREYVEALLERCDWNISRAATEAGLDRNSIYRIIKKYNLADPALILSVSSGDGLHQGHSQNFFPMTSSFV
jgi:DNA-binding phage protein